MISGYPKQLERTSPGYNVVPGLVFQRLAIPNLLEQTRLGGSCQERSVEHCQERTRTICPLAGDAWVTQTLKQGTDILTMLEHPTRGSWRINVIHPFQMNQMNIIVIKLQIYFIIFIFSSSLLNCALNHLKHQGEEPHNPAQWVVKTPGRQGQGKSYRKIKLLRLSCRKTG